MEKKPSLRSIAQQAGVSTTLVSYVLNGKMQNRIKPEVAARVREIAKRLNYSPNQIARSLKANKTFTIGLVVADISNPFSSEMARIIEDQADKAGYTVIYGSCDERAEKFQKLIEVFLDRRVDGLIVIPCDGVLTQIQYLQSRDIPFVLVDRYFPDLASSYVALDNYQASYMGTNHLLDHGHHRIGMITLDTQLYHMRERTRGFISALSGVDSSPEQSIVRLHEGFSAQDMADAFDILLKRDLPVSALYLTTNKLGMHALKYIHSRKIKVPQELAVVSFDETEFLDLFATPVTQIIQPLQEMGSQAVRILMESIGGNSGFTQLNLQPLLAVRGSSIGGGKDLILKESS